MEFVNFDLRLSLSEDSSTLTAEWIDDQNTTRAFGKTELDPVQWDKVGGTRTISLKAAVHHFLDGGGVLSSREGLARHLGNAMLPSAVRNELNTLLTRAEADARRVRLRIACSTNADPYPWEFAHVTLQSFAGAIGVHPRISVTRDVPDAATYDLSPETNDLRITMVDSLWGLEDRQTGGAARPGWPALSSEFLDIREDLLEADPKRHPTLTDIETVNSTILHYRGHGRGERYVGVKESAITLWDEGKPVEWTAAEFASALLKAGLRAKLVVLQACSTADSTGRHGFGIRLLRGGVRAVIASPADVRDDQATRFFGKFYAELAETGDIELALMETRQSAAADPRLQEQWWAHALYCNHPPNTRFIARVRQMGASSSVERPYTWVHYALGNPGTDTRHIRLEVPRQSETRARWAVSEKEASSPAAGITGTEQRRDSMVVRGCPSGRVVGHLANGALHLYAVNQVPTLARDEDERSTLLATAELEVSEGLPSRLFALRACSQPGSSTVTAVLYGARRLSTLTVDLKTGPSVPRVLKSGRFRAATIVEGLVAAITDDQKLWLDGNGKAYELLRSRMPEFNGARLVDIDACEVPASGVTCIAVLGEKHLWCVSNHGVLRHNLSGASAVQLLRPGRRPQTLKPTPVWPIDALVWFRQRGPEPVPALTNAASGT